MDDLCVIIKNIDSGNLNTRYGNKLLSDYIINQSSINVVNFKNGRIAIVSFKSVISKDMFLNLDFRNTSYSYLFKQRSLSSDIRKLGLIYYHSIKSGSCTSHKLVFNNCNMSYELRILIDNRIDCISSSYSPSQAEL